MRKKTYQIVGDRLMLAQSAVTFVTDGGLSAGSTVAQKTFPGPFEGTPVTAAALNSGPDSPGTLPTKQRGEPKETSPVPQGSGAIRDRNREGEGNQPKLAQSAAAETFLRTLARLTASVGAV